MSVSVFRKFIAIVFVLLNCSYFQQNKFIGENDCVREYQILRNDCYSFVVKLPLLINLVFPPEKSSEEAKILYYKLFDYGLLKCLENEIKKKECNQMRFPFIKTETDDLF